MRIISSVERRVPAAQQVPELTSFTTEMRTVAMNLHTRDQAREGKQEAETPFQQWQPQRSDYLQFLVDSRHVYQAMETIVNQDPYFSRFCNTGLERVEALRLDIQWFVEEGEIEPSVSENALSYESLLLDLAAKNKEAFINHFYNHYFAHTAGGRMIGAKMSKMLLGGRTLNFYKWEGDVKEMLSTVKAQIDDLASEWSQEQRQRSLDETRRAFQYSGSLLSPLRGPT